MFGGDGLFWIIVLFLFAFMGGWGNNGYNGGAAVNMYGVQDGFNQQAIMGALGTISANQTAYQLTNTQSMNSLAMSLQNCCCENRANIADLKYTVATENCADRQALSESTRDIIANQTAGIQAILDKMCQQEIDALKTQNANLQTQINLATLRESQTAQTAQILANNEAQTAALEQYLAPVARPAYIVQNPNGCNCNNGCGCGSFV